MCNSPSNSLLDIISFLTVPPEFFHQKNCKPLKQVHVEASTSYLMFLSILNALSCNTLPEIVLLFKSLKCP